MYIHGKTAISPVLVWRLTTPDSTQGVIKVPSTHVCLFLGDFSSFHLPSIRKWCFWAPQSKFL